MARSKKKGKKGTKGNGSGRSMALKLGLPIALALTIPVAVLLTSSGLSTSVSYDEVLMLDDQHLLLVGSSGSDVDVNRLGRLARLGPDGTVTMMAEEDGAVSLLGIGREVIWVSSQDRGIHARRLADLSPIVETTGVVDDHAALNVKRRALGLSGDMVVLDGMDGPYTLAPDGTLEKQAKDFEYARGVPATLGPIDLPLPNGCAAGDASSQALAKSLANTLTEAHFMSCGRRRGFVTFDDPPGKLVADTVYDAESRTRRLVRVDETGTVLWATPANDLVAALPFEERGGLVTILWAGWWSDELRALIESSSFERTSYDGETHEYVTVEHRLVAVDEATGQPTSVVALVSPEG